MCQAENRPLDRNTEDSSSDEILGHCALSAVEQIALLGEQFIDPNQMRKIADEMIVLEAHRGMRVGAFDLSTMLTIPMQAEDSAPIAGQIVEKTGERLSA